MKNMNPRDTVIGDYKHPDNTGIMIKLLKKCAKIGIAVVASLFILSLFTLIYSYSGVHITNKTGATDYKWEPHQFKSNMREGFSWLYMNEDGFNNQFNAEGDSNIDILLMGSSHMEAVNIGSDKNVGYLLNSGLSEYTIYNIGMSGHDIYHCVNNLKKAVDYYNPTEYVIIETDELVLDQDQIMSVINGDYPIIPSYDHGMMYTVQKMIPCFQPIYREIINWKNASANMIQVDDKGDTSSVTDEYYGVLSDFLSFIDDSAEGRKVILVYHPRIRIDDKDFAISENDADTERFNELCRDHQIEFVDMTDDFISEYVLYHNMPHGFSNTAVGVGHLNETGHRLMANRLCKVVKRLDGTE